MISINLEIVMELSVPLGVRLVNTPFMLFINISNFCKTLNSKKKNKII